MRPLWVQLVRFGIVGAVSFIIDFGLFNLLVYWRINAVLASVISFTVSLMFNYICSMRYVFVRRGDMARWMEMLIFALSALVGLLINVVIVWAATRYVIPPALAGSNRGLYQMCADGAKLVATGIVMVWNFIIRKWLLEPPSDRLPTWARTVSETLGAWSKRQAG